MMRSKHGFGLVHGYVSGGFCIFHQGYLALASLSGIFHII
jgi:hypothetical protein